MKKYGSKGNDKNRLQKYAILSWSDGVTMVGQDQAPNRSDNDSSQPGPQMIRGIYARSRGVAMVRVRPSPQVILWP